MADWAYTPDYPDEPERIPPRVLVTRFDDHGENTRQKGTRTLRRFKEPHFVDTTTMEAMLGFFDARGLKTTFTKQTHDPTDPALTETTVRFSAPPQYRRVAVDSWEATFFFVEVLS